MTQHVFHTEHNGCPVEVMLGFDRGMGHFFMVVVRDSGTDTAATLYTNLEETNAFDKDLAYFKAKLAELMLTVPEAMFEEVEIDKRTNAGNRRVLHAPDGSFTSL